MPAPHGLVVTIDALTPLAAGVFAYLSDGGRMGTSAPPVLTGEWETEKNNGPSLVVIGLGKKLSYAGAAAEEPGFRNAPSYSWDNGDGTACPVVGVRKQSMVAWVHYAPPDFPTHDPVAYPVDMRVATLALADVVHAALRYIAGHDLLGEDGQPYGEQRGEFVFGSTISFGFVVPVPVLGDAYTYQTPPGMTASALFTGTSPGDALTT